MRVNRPEREDPPVNPDEYIAGVDERRRADVVALDALITEAAPNLERGIQYGMLAYGDTALIALAAQKRYLSLYVSCEKDGEYLAGSYADRLPKASIGKSCVRFTALDRVDVDVLREMITEAARMGDPRAASGDA